MTSKRWWTTGIKYIDILYLPYTLMTVCYVIIGSLLGSHPNYRALSILIIGWFIAVGIVAHALDELHGHPLNTNFEDGVLVWMAGVGIIVCTVLALLFAFIFDPVFVVFFVLLAFILVAYNAELFKSRFHRDMVFTIGFALLPMFIGFYFTNFYIPSFSDIFFMFGLAATASIETVVNHWLKFNSKDYHIAYDKDLAYLNRAVWATVFIVYMIALSFIFRKLGF